MKKAPSHTSERGSVSGDGRNGATWLEEADGYGAVRNGKSLSDAST